MTAIGEIIVFMLYAVMFSLALVCLLKTIVSTSKLDKYLYLIGFFCSIGIFLMYFNFKSNSHRTSELEYVGYYNLTNYPNCETCKVFLKENNISFFAFANSASKSKFAETSEAS